MAVDAIGRAATTLRIPSDPTPLGAALSCQRCTTVPDGPWLGAVALGDAVRLVLGH